MGHVGNNGTLDTDYATSIANRTIAPGTGAFRFGSTYGAIEGDFDMSGEGFTSFDQGVAAGGYTVREGDTLETIAASLWGDSALWYKLAEANGLTGSGGLAEGRRLSVPAGTIRSHHNASTFKPYDPAETIGDLSPATPKPQKAKSGKCGTFGIILLVAIAVAVTVVTSGAAVAALSSAGSIGTGIGSFVAGTAGFGTMVTAGAIGGAVGSIASQGFGGATGIQDKFSWKAVALAGLAGGISAGLGKAFPAVGAAAAGSETASKLGTLSLIGRGAFIGVSGSALTQGVGTLVGLQKNFDFAGVAAAGLAGGASAGVGKALNAGPLSDLSARNIGANLATSTANAIANAATRSLINGSDFGDNMLAALPDIIGSTIGNMLAYGVSGAKSAGQLRLERADAHEAMHGAELSGAALSTPGVTEVAAAEDDIVISGSRRVVTDGEIALEAEEDFDVSGDLWWPGHDEVLFGVAAMDFADRIDPTNPDLANSDLDFLQMNPFEVSVKDWSQRDALFRYRLDELTGQRIMIDVDGSDLGSLNIELVQRNAGRIDLRQHEGRGIPPGHTISFHVGKSRAFLMTMMAENRAGWFSAYRTRMSTFRSLQSANALVSATLATGREVSPGVFYREFRSPTGIAAVRRDMVPLIRPQGRVRFETPYGVLVVTRPDTTMPQGFRIHTAYPTIPFSGRGR